MSSSQLYLNIIQKQGNIQVQQPNQNKKIQNIIYQTYSPKNQQEKENFKKDQYFSNDKRVSSSQSNRDIQTKLFQLLKDKNEKLIPQIQNDLEIDKKKLNSDLHEMKYSNLQQSLSTDKLQSSNRLSFNFNSKSKQTNNTLNEITKIIDQNKQVRQNQIDRVLRQSSPKFTIQKKPPSRTSSNEKHLSQSQSIDKMIKMSSDRNQQKKDYNNQTNNNLLIRNIISQTQKKDPTRKSFIQEKDPQIKAFPVTEFAQQKSRSQPHAEDDIYIEEKNTTKLQLKNSSPKQQLHYQIPFQFAQTFKKKENDDQLNHIMQEFKQKLQKMILMHLEKEKSWQKEKQELLQIIQDLQIQKIYE